jgi:hypothetical protein
MDKNWRKILFVDLYTDKKPRKTDGIRNPMRAVSYASVGAERWNDV